MSVLIPAWHGLGDNVYLRPFVKAAVEAGEDVYLETPWPQLFSDLDVRCVRPKAKYRTQTKNVEAQPEETWHRPPTDARVVKPPRVSAGRSITGAIAASSPWPIGPSTFDLPSFPRVGLAAYPSPTAVVRPNMVRAEWENPSRNPKATYITKAREILQRTHYVVSVAYVEKGEEWIAQDFEEFWADQQVSEADVLLHHGQLTIERLLALIENADVVVGGVGFILPVAVAYATPVLIIGGGNGGHNAPERLVGYGMDAFRVRWIMPDDYCRCLSYDHKCPKDISDFEGRFTAALAELAEVPVG